MRSISEDRFNSLPPSLPIASTTKDCSSPDSCPIGNPYFGRSAATAKETAARMQQSARPLSSVKVSSTVANCATSRQIMRTKCRCRNVRKAARQSDSDALGPHRVARAASHCSAVHSRVTSKVPSASASHNQADCRPAWSTKKSLPAIKVRKVCD